MKDKLNEFRQYLFDKGPGEKIRSLVLIVENEDGKVELIYNGNKYHLAFLSVQLQGFVNSMCGAGGYKLMKEHGEIDEKPN